MKTLLAVCLACLAVTEARAVNYTGQYAGFLYHGDRIVAGINFAVGDDNSVQGRGTYIDFTEIDLQGTVSSTGLVSITENDEGDRKSFSYTAQFTPNGKKILAGFPDGDTIRAKRVSPDLPEAGTYYIREDTGEDGVLFIAKDGTVSGVIYVDYYDYIDINGTATSAGFSATDDDGVVYTTTFADVSRFTGSYDDGQDFFGNIVGSKY